MRCLDTFTFSNLFAVEHYLVLTLMRSEPANEFNFWPVGKESPPWVPRTAYGMSREGFLLLARHFHNSAERERLLAEHYTPTEAVRCAV